MKRPTAWICVYYVTGLCVFYYELEISAKILVFTLIIISSTILYKTYYWKGILFFPLICFFAYIQFFIVSHQNENHHKIINVHFDESIECTINGSVGQIVKQDKLQSIVKTEEILIGAEVYKVSYNIKVYGDKNNELSIGDKIVIQGYINKILPPRNPGSFNEMTYYKSKKIDYKLFAKNIEIIEKGSLSLKNVLYTLRNKASHIYDQLLPEKQSSIIKAMILGEKQYLTIEQKEAYQQSGISHILAISGLHISILGYGLYRMLIRLISRKNASLVTIAFLILYCMLTGGSTSTIRAVYMLILIIIAEVIGRTNDIYSSLSLTALSLLVYNPYYLWDIGFLLSFSAVLGIVALVPILDSLYNEKDNVIISIFNVSLAAFLITTPILLYNFYELHIYSIIINIIVVPLMSLIIMFGFIALITGSVWIIIGKFFSGIIFFVLSLYDIISKASNALPLSSIVIGRPHIINIILYYSLMIMFILLVSIKDNYRKILINSIKIVLCFTVIINTTLLMSNDYLMITHLDVGQGDCAVILSPDKDVYIIDGGGTVGKTIDDRDVGYYTIKPFLMMHGISKIHGIFLSHSDMDHIMGLIEILDYFKVDYLAVPAPYRTIKDELYTKLETKVKEKNVEILYLGEGDRITHNELKITSLYPNSKIENYKNNNAYSLVLDVRYHLFNVLFTGDLEKEQEKYLVSKNVRLQSEVLKTPHHGSDTSSTEEFVDKIQPSIAIISSGKNNRYGHPSRSVVERYRSKDISMYNTANDGAITIKTDGINYSVSTFYTYLNRFYEIH